MFGEADLFFQQKNQRVELVLMAEPWTGFETADKDKLAPTAVTDRWMRLGTVIATTDADDLAPGTTAEDELTPMAVVEP